MGKSQKKRVHQLQDSTPGHTDTDPRERLRARLRAQKQLRGRTSELIPVPPSAVQVSEEDRLRVVAQWVLKQLVRDHGTTIHGMPTLCLLFNVDLSADPEWLAGTILGSSLDVLLVKVNSAVYYEVCHHMNGLKWMVASGRQKLAAEPERLLYVCNPTQHLRGARADIQFDLSRVSYVDRIPVTLVGSNENYRFELQPEHLPTIGQKPLS